MEEELPCSEPVLNWTSALEWAQAARRDVQLEGERGAVSPRPVPDVVVVVQPCPEIEAELLSPVHVHAFGDLIFQERLLRTAKDNNQSPNNRFFPFESIWVRTGAESLWKSGQRFNCLNYG